MEELTQYLRWSGGAGSLLTEEAFLLEERSSRVQITALPAGEPAERQVEQLGWQAFCPVSVACLGFFDAAATAVTVLGS